MKARTRLVVLFSAFTVLMVAIGSASAAVPETPGVGVCLAGAGYASGCDVNQDGAINVLDVQITAGRWNTSGAYAPGHTHLGETWTGLNNPLTINGSFQTAPLVTANNDTLGDGLYVSHASNNGMRVEEAGPSAVHTYSLLPDGFEVNYAQGRGVFVGQADLEGVAVYHSNEDALKVFYAGNPAGASVASTAYNGLEVQNAQGNGVFVGHSDGDGVHVEDGGYNAGYFNSGFSNGNGVYARAANGNAAYGVWGVATQGYAGYFSGKAQVNGNLAVFGTLSKTAGSFKIDDPIDPANKYLYHSFVESPDMKNIYDGVVTLDADGQALVTLPDWFEALNEEFRYQLTCVGGYAPVYIAQEVKDNQFSIAGGTPGLRVSWQVTGIRHDPYAEDNRIPVEQWKDQQDRGRYVYPAGYDKPANLWVAENLEKPSPDQPVISVPDAADPSILTTTP